MSWLNWLQGGAGASEGTCTPQDLLQELRAGRTGCIVDVRQPEELAGPLGALPGVKNIPLAEIGRRLGEIPKDRPVTLVCLSGRRSGQALSFLRSQGYTQVRNVRGGMLAVRAAKR